MKHHDDRHRRVWTPEAVGQLGVTTDIETAASVLGIGRTLAFELARTGQFPVRLLRPGRRIIVPVSDLRSYLGIDQGYCVRCANEAREA